MCTEQQHDDLLKKLDAIRMCLLPRESVDFEVPVSAALAWPIDYRGYKHVYLWLASTTTLDFEAYGSGSVQGQVWTNLGMRQGTQITAPNAGSTPVFLQIRCSDEVIP